MLAEVIYGLLHRELVAGYNGLNKVAVKKAHEVERFLQQDIRPWSIFLVYGPDRGLVLERLDKVVSKFGVNQSDPFCFINLASSNFDADPFVLLNEVQTISLFGSLRLILVKGSANHKALLNSLDSLLDNAEATNAVVIIEAGELRPQDELRRRLEQHQLCMVLPCYSDDSRTLSQLVDNTLAQMQLTILPEAKDYLLTQLGGDRSATRQELEKLCLYANEAGCITIDHVKASVSDVAHSGADMVVDALLLGDLWKLEVHFERFKSQSGNVTWLVMDLIRQFNLIYQLQVKRLQQGLSVNQVVAQARPAIFYKRKPLIEKALSYWSADNLQRIQVRLTNLSISMRKNNSLAVDLLRNALVALTLDVYKKQK